MDAPAAAAAAAAAVQMLCLVSANVGGNLAANRGRKRSLSAMGQSSAPAPPTLVTPLGLGDAGDLAAKSALTKPESPTDAEYSRKDKSLGVLCERFMQQYGNKMDALICLDEAATVLGMCAAPGCRVSNGFARPTLQMSAAGEYMTSSTSWRAWRSSAAKRRTDTPGTGPPAYRSCWRNCG